MCRCVAGASAAPHTCCGNRVLWKNLCVRVEPQKHERQRRNMFPLSMHGLDARTRRAGWWRTSIRMLSGHPLSGLVFVIVHVAVKGSPVPCELPTERINQLHTSLSSLPGLADAAGWSGLMGLRRQRLMSFAVYRIALSFLFEHAWPRRAYARGGLVADLDPRALRSSTKWIGVRDRARALS